MSTIDFAESRRALSELRNFLKTLRHLQEFGEQVSALESLESLATAAERKLAEAEKRAVAAGSAADNAEAESNQRIAVAKASVADAEARASDAIEAARLRAAEDTTAAEQHAVEAIATITARREQAEREAASRIGSSLCRARWRLPSPSAIPSVERSRTCGPASPPSAYDIGS